MLSIQNKEAVAFEYKFTLNYRKKIYLKYSEQGKKKTYKFLNLITILTFRKKLKIPNISFEPSNNIRI